MRSARLPDPGDDPWQVVEVCPCHSHHGIPQPTKPVLAPLLCHERVRATIAVLDLAVELDHNAGALDDEVDPGDEVPGLVGDDHPRFERDAGDRQREPQPRLPHGFRAAVHVGQHRADPAGSRPAVHRPCGLGQGLDHDHLPVHGGVSGHDPGGSPTLQAVLDQSDRGRHLTVNRRVTAVEDRRGHRLVRARSHRAQRWTDDEPLRQHLPDHRPHEVSPRQVGAPEGYAHRSERAVAGELRVGIVQQAATRQTKVRSLGGEGLPARRTAYTPRARWSHAPALTRAMSPHLPYPALAACCVVKRPRCASAAAASSGFTAPTMKPACRRLEVRDRGPVDGVICGNPPLDEPGDATRAHLGRVDSAREGSPRGAQLCH